MRFRDFRANKESNMLDAAARSGFLILRADRMIAFEDKQFMRRTEASILVSVS